MTDSSFPPSSESNSSTPKTSTGPADGSGAMDPSEAIDQVDAELLQLFDQRARLVRATSKPDDRVAGFVADAAERIDAAVQAYGKTREKTDQSGLGTSDQVALLRHLSSVCLSSVVELSVAFLGPEHSYSHLATLKYFGDAASLLPVSSIASVFSAVERGESRTGVVPIENSTDGRIVDTLGMFVQHGTSICGEVLLPIHHHLLSKTPRSQITQVQSKPQALSQCRQWLDRHLPSAEVVEVSSTTTAAKNAATDSGVAAIASLEAGREYGLDIVSSAIEDNPNNVTRFAVLGKEQPPASGDDKTTVLFQLDHQPGALAEAMTIFKETALNLTWIESFPAPGMPNEYYFFIEFTGHRSEPAVETAIGRLGEMTRQTTVLGSYPRAR